MSYLLLIGLALAFYYIYQLEKRIKDLESTRGSGYSHNFTIKGIFAVMQHSKFGELSNIKSAHKPYKEWPEADKKKWQSDFSQDIRDLTNVYITYLANENAFFIKTVSEKPYIVLRGDASNLLYSRIVLGDKDGLDECLEFDIYERLVKDSSGKYVWVITPCISYTDGKLLDGMHDFQVLCEYPFLEENTESYYEERGFEMIDRGGDDIYEDSFGKKNVVPRIVTLKKNGVEIERVY